MTAEDVVAKLEEMRVPFVLTESGRIRARDLREPFGLQNRCCPISVLLALDRRDNALAITRGRTDLGLSFQDAADLVHAGDGGFDLHPIEADVERIGRLRVRLRALVVEELRGGGLL